MNRTRFSVRFASAGLIFAMFSACQPVPPEEEPQEPLAQQEPLRVTEIMARSDAAGVVSGPITPDDPVHVVVRTTGATQGADLLVQVFALANGSTVGSQALRLDAASEPEQSLRFQNQIPWQPGRYLIEVTLDDELAGHRELEIHPKEPANAGNNE